MCDSMRQKQTLQRMEPQPEPPQPSREEESQRRLAQRLKHQTRTLTQWAERIVQQSQFADLALRPVQRQQPSKIPVEQVVCLFHLDELVFLQQDGYFEQLTTVLNALHKCEASCILLLRHENHKNDLYLGVVNRRTDNLNYLSVLRGVLKGGVEETLDGTRLQEVPKSRIQDTLEHCLDDRFSCQCVTAVSCVAAVDRNERMSSGIEAVLESAEDVNFSLLVIADAVGQGRIDAIRRGYESIGTQLSAQEAISYSRQQSISLSEGINISQTISDSLSRSISQTKSHTDQSGWSSGTSEQKNRAAGAAGGIAAVALAAAKELSSPIMAASFASQLITGGNQTRGESGSVSDTDSSSDSRTVQSQQGRQYGTNRTRTAGTSDSTQYSVKNRHIANLLRRLDQYLDWMERRENYGMYDSCTYILSASAATNRIIASQYQALIQGEDEFAQPITLNEWTGENAERVRSYLMRMNHPQIDCGEGVGSFTPAMLASSREISRQMPLPHKSVVGLSVMQYADFSRGIVTAGGPAAAGQPASRLRIGQIVHHGKIDPNQQVWLDLQSLAAHTFVAGTNGSGKSNTVFRILEELDRCQIPFMVIEPAKGEYKNLFGKDPGVQVYGTNPRKMRLLQINPFYFNEDVDLSEHIDRLLSVFNSSWPMYSAMPQVLKESIQQAYAHCGWNLRTRRFAAKRLQLEKPIFPTVRDVLREFHTVMESTRFSGEVKGNYEGALSTRLESLCSGIFQEIFSGNNLDDRALFESKIIIDLSSIGSSETKAMLMGMLLIRLQEYRLRVGSMNRPLQHITVLEEAHHLLRKTSFAQSNEGANLMGRSVEMLTSAIAEMRSAGEGFVIVDQSPGLLDEAVLRNTNTKLIMRLPEGGDRDIVSRTMGLDEAQSFELSRLKTGICAVYQQNWMGAVLCQVDRAEHQAQAYRPDLSNDPVEASKAALVKQLYDSACRNASHLEMEHLPELPLSGRKKYELLCQSQNGRIKQELLGEILMEFYPLEMELPARCDREQMRQWYAMTAEENGLYPSLTPELAEWVIHMQLQLRQEQDPAWSAAASNLPDSMQPQDPEALRTARGIAFCCICPLRGQGAPALDRAELQDSFSILDRSLLPDDHKLAALLEAYFSQGRRRQASELEPYVSLAWSYFGGAEVWESLLDFIKTLQYDQWDTAARQQLSQLVHSGADTQSAILALVLQCKGKMPAVRNFFGGWYKRFAFPGVKTQG